MPRSELHVIDAEPALPGAAAAYLRIEGEEAAFIEAYTAPNVGRLLAALETHGLEPRQVRWLFITHAHLDHAGGASALLAACPNAVLATHPRAARHLIDPARLVASATHVYGAELFERLYGRIEPIPATRVQVLEDGATVPFGSGQIEAVHLRGHANHHTAFLDRAADTVFTGDAFGLHYPRLQRAGPFAFPSTSPTDFDGPAAHAAIDRVVGLKTGRVHPTHFGEVTAIEETAAQLHAGINRSEALLAEARLHPAEARQAWLHTQLTLQMDSAAELRGLELNDDDRALLALDLGLNAQGLAWVAGKDA